jgi:diguanylate cyclase (GGDEF)-like protein/PAS domain S-box-containing protein
MTAGGPLDEEVATRVRHIVATGAGEVQMAERELDVTGPEESNALFRLAMEHSAIGMTLVAPEGSFLTVNPALCSMLGREDAELKACTWQQLTHPDDLDVDVALVEQVLAGERDDYRLLKRFLRADGAVVWGDLSVSCVRDANGAVAYFVSQIVDVTEATLAREQYRLLAENASDVVLQTSPDGQISWVSPSVTEVLGWDVSQVLGRRYAELIHPDDVGPARAAVHAALDSGTVHGTFELRVATAHGDWRWMADRGQAIVDERGVVVGGVDSLRDIEVERRTRLALRDSEEHYRLLAHNSSDVIVRTHRSVVSWISPSLTPTLGWDPEEWIGEEIFTFIHPDEADEVRRRVQDLYGGDGDIMRLRVRHKDSSFHWIEVNARPYKGADGREDGGVSSFRVIDADVAAEQELERRATYDDLSGLLRRDEVLKRLATIGRRTRRPGDDTGLLFCDIDGFKAVNDAYGHAAGDEMIRALADRIRSVVRLGDAVARMGGDEFLIVLDGIHGLDEAIAVAEKVRCAAAAPVAYGRQSLATTISIGATIGRPGEGVDAMIGRADDAMYEAKAAGRDQVFALPRH